MMNNRKIKKENFKYKKNLSIERWTLDEPEDLIVIRNIFKRFKSRYIFSWKEILKLRNKFKDDFKANLNINRDEGSTINSGQKLWRRAKKSYPEEICFYQSDQIIFFQINGLHIIKKKDCSVWDLDGNKFLDMSLMGVGTNILGYNNYKVDDAVKKCLQEEIFQL